MDENRIRQIFAEEIQKAFSRGFNPDLIPSTFLTQDRFIFQRLLQMLDGVNILIGRTTGTQIGTTASEKIAFHGSTPVIQAAAIAAPAGGATVDQPARDAINLIITVLKNKGFTA